MKTIIWVAPVLLIASAVLFLVKDMHECVGHLANTAYVMAIMLILVIPIIVNFKRNARRDEERS